MHDEVTIELIPRKTICRVCQYKLKVKTLWQDKS
jgi:hypothetical protein